MGSASSPGSRHSSEPLFLTFVGGRRQEENSFFPAGEGRSSPQPVGLTCVSVCVCARAHACECVTAGGQE